MQRCYLPSKTKDGENPKKVGNEGLHVTGVHLDH